MTYGFLQGVADEIGRPISDDAEMRQVNQWLARVERMIRARIPNLDSLILAGRLDAGLVADVEHAAVARKALNPENLRQTTISVDDGSLTKLRDSSVSDGQLRILQEEWALLTPATRGTSFTVRPARST